MTISHVEIRYWLAQLQFSLLDSIVLVSRMWIISKIRPEMIATSIGLEVDNLDRV